MPMRLRKRMAMMTSDQKLLRSILRRPFTIGAAIIAKLRAMLSRQCIDRYAGSLLIGIAGIQISIRKSLTVCRMAHGEASCDL
jgi:hypothetical protein